MGDLLGGAEPGKVTILSRGDSVPGAIQVGGLDAGSLPIMINSVGMSASVNVQFALSLRRVVYVYALGDRMGQITVSGMAFDDACGRTSSGGGGFKVLIDYYNDNRAAVRTTPITISIAGEAFSAYLVEMRANASSTFPGVFNFTLSLASLAKSHTSKSDAANRTSTNTNDTRSSSGGSTRDDTSSGSTNAANVEAYSTPIETGGRGDGIALSSNRTDAARASSAAAVLAAARSAYSAVSAAIRTGA